MNKQLFKTINSVDDFEKLQILEANIQSKNANTDEVKVALARRFSELGLKLIAEKTELDLDECTPAEVKIAEAVGRYIGLQKRAGKYPSRTFSMLANRGLIDTAERAVSKSKPTQGFEVLEDADMGEVSFEQIVVDHPSEFSPRAEWYSRQTLGMANASGNPPASSELPTQVWTQGILQWLVGRLSENNGNLTGYSNSDVGAAVGFSDLSKHGRVLGNVTSRIDFACYKVGLPPLGLVAHEPFPKAWQQDGRTWGFPVSEMATAAKGRAWRLADLDRILEETKHLPGTASIPWKAELISNELLVRRWAEGLKNEPQKQSLVRVNNALNAAIDDMQKLEQELLQQTPKEKIRTSAQIERGTIGKAVKKLNGYKCQICEALGEDPFSFRKKNGIPYVEAHHVVPVSEKQLGSLAASNIMTLCANHHREMHYGSATVKIHDKSFEVAIGGNVLRMPRCVFGT